MSRTWLAVTQLSLMVLCLLTSIVGLSVYSALTSSLGPASWKVVNPFIGLWSSGLLAAASAQGLLMLIRPDPRQRKRIFYAQDFAYFVLVAVLGLFMSVFWRLFGRVDLVVLNALMCAVGIVCAALVANSTPSSSNANDTSKENSSRTGSQKCSLIIEALSLTSKLLLLVVTCLLANGAYIHGSGTLRYPPAASGRFFELTQENRTQNVYYRCQGSREDFPVVIFESDGSHGVGDWLGTLVAAREHGDIRICVIDKLGLGHTDYLRAEQCDQSHADAIVNSYYLQLIDGLVESEPNFQPPYIFVGWGGGGPTVYHYAMNQPDRVHGLVVLDAALAGVEWRIPAMLGNWTQEEYDAYVEEDLASRVSIFRIINGLGVPFGLVGPFLENLSNDYWGPEDAEEQRWYFLTEKTWISQRWYVAAMSGNTSNIFANPIAARIPVHSIVTHKSEEQIERLVCQPQGLSPEDCQFQKDFERIMYQEKLTIPSNGGRVVECDMDKCGLGYYVFDNPGFTVDAVIQLFQS